MARDSRKEGTLEDSSDTFGSLLRKHRQARGLNQLALGTRAFLDNTTISRFETGKQLPSSSDFERLSAALGLSTNDREELSFALQQDILRKKSISSELYLHPEELLLLISEEIKSTRELRLNGRGQFAAAEASRHIHWLHTFIGRTKRDSLREALLRSLAALLMEQSKSYQDFVLLNEVDSYITPLIAKQQEIAKSLNDKRLSLLADLTIEGSQFLHGNIDRAQKVCLQILQKKHHLNSEWQQEILRASVINAGHLGDYESVMQISKHIKQTIENVDFDPMAEVFLLEGLARSQGLVKSSKAFKTLEKAWDLLEAAHKQGAYTGLRTVQTIRTQLKIMRSLGDTNGAEIERIGTRGILICSELGYPRHQMEIEELLDILLN